MDEFYLGPDDLDGLLNRLDDTTRVVTMRLHTADWTIVAEQTISMEKKENGRWTNTELIEFKNLGDDVKNVTAVYDGVEYVQRTNIFADDDMSVLESLLSTPHIIPPARLASYDAMLEEIDRRSSRMTVRRILKYLGIIWFLDTLEGLWTDDSSSQS